MLCAILSANWVWTLTSPVTFSSILGHMTSSFTLVSCPLYIDVFCKDCLLPESELCGFLISNFFCMPLDLHQPQATHGYGANEPASQCSLGLWECLSRGPWGSGEHSFCVLVCPGRKFLTSCFPGE